MNKLAPLAFAVLMLLGGALWYLAAGSLNAYLKSTIESTSSSLSQHKVTVATVDVHTAQGSGEITGFKIWSHDQQSLAIESIENQEQEVLFQANKVSFSFAVESLQKSPMVITEIIIDQPQLFIAVHEQAKLQLLISVLESNLKKLTNKLQSSEKQQEPLVAIKRVLLKNINFSTQQEQVKSISLSVTANEQGEPISLALGEILKQCLHALAQQS